MTVLLFNPFQVTPLPVCPVYLSLCVCLCDSAGSKPLTCGKVGAILKINRFFSKSFSHFCFNLQLKRVERQTWLTPT